ncbi:hypothetical protein ElyMa_002197800 [Elysia marginata]|uniref:Uncharacterized protein n=1 Tax=Elysia marginata TaxID=1093978 RepID=A0AAV4FRV2_9GAST|nr:hypothetical protein ElyMa_002197800 [Elysia marginata]
MLMYTNFVYLNAVKNQFPTRIKNGVLSYLDLGCPSHAAAPEEKPDQSPKAAPKLVLGRKQYGRRSLPIGDDLGGTAVTKSQEQHKSSPTPPEGSYSQFLRDLDTNDRSSPSVVSCMSRETSYLD